LRSDSELWDVGSWPSPSSEAVVQARVLGRARTITRRRLAPVVALLVVASVAALQHLPSMQTSAKVHVTDTPGKLLPDEPVPGTRPSGPSVGTVGGGQAGLSAGSGSGTTGAKRPGGTAVGSQPSSGGRPAGAGPAATRPVPFADPRGDAAEQTNCGNGSCTGAPNQPALDYVGGSLELLSDTVRLSARMDDLGAPIPYDETLDGAQGRAGYHIYFDVGDYTRQFGFHVYRDLADGELSFLFTYSNGTVSRAFTGAEATFDVDADALTFVAQLASLNQALATDGNPPLTADTLVRATFFTSVESYPASSPELVKYRTFDSMVHQDMAGVYRLGG
jgi:hypothetical protein